MRIYTCAPTPPVPRPAWASAAGSRATTPPGPIRHSAIGRPMRSTNHRRSRGLLRHRSVWQHDRHYSPQGDRPELRSLSRLSKLGGPAQPAAVWPLVADEVGGTTARLHPNTKAFQFGVHEKHIALRIGSQSVDGSLGDLWHVLCWSVSKSNAIRPLVGRGHPGDTRGLQFGKTGDMSFAL